MILNKGRLFWFTGLAGAGKTTIAKLFFKDIRIKFPNSVFLDGDILREVLGNSDSFTTDDRFRLAMTYSRLAKMLTDQNIIVICATISMFHEVRKWNRENISNYSEIYLKVPFEILKKRDQKGIYSGYSIGSHNNIVGIDIDFEEPQMPDLVVNNDGSKSPNQIVKELMQKFRRELQ